MSQPKATKKPLDLGEALGVFGALRREHPEHAAVARLGQRLVRLAQHLHNVLAYARTGLPARHMDHIDPARLDTALARTAMKKWAPEGSVTDSRVASLAALLRELAQAAPLIGWTWQQQAEWLVARGMTIQGPHPFDGTTVTLAQTGTPQDG